MPCIDARVEDEYHYERIRLLEHRNNRLMRCICNIDKTHKLNLSALTEESRRVIESHRLFDESRQRDHIKAALKKKGAR